MTAGALELSCNILTSLIFREPVDIVVHDDPLAERLVGSQIESIVDLCQPDKKDDRSVARVHLKVEQDLEVAEDIAGYVIRLVDDDDRSLALLNRQPGDLFLYEMEVIHLAEGRLSAELQSQITVKIVDGQSRKA